MFTHHIKTKELLLNMCDNLRLVTNFYVKFITFKFTGECMTSTSVNSPSTGRLKTYKYITLQFILNYIKSTPSAKFVSLVNFNAKC